MKTKKQFKIKCFLLILAIYILPQISQAQDSTGVIDEIIENAVEISGEIGMQGELYNISGKQARRPNSLGRIYFQPSIRLFDAVSFDFNFFLSTEGSQAKQDINNIGISPTWSWGRAYAGDFSEQYSVYSLNGIKVRGGGININPGIFRFAAMGGLAQRAVPNQAYRREVYGAKLGVGREENSFFDIILLKIKDDVASMKPDTSDYYSVKPQENTVGGFLSQLNLFDDKFRLNTEVMGSIITRDLNAAFDEELDVPKEISNFMKINYSTGYDVAGATELNVNLGAVRFKTGYRYIGPGYTALSSSSTLNDVQEFTFGTSFTIGGVRVNADYGHQNDNLINQKIFTLNRDKISGGINLNPVSNWSASIIGNFFTMKNNSSVQSSMIDFKNLTLGTTNVFTFSHSGLVRNAVFSYMYQSSGDNSPLKKSSKIDVHTINLQSSVMLHRSLSLTPSISIVNFKSAIAGSNLTQTYGLSFMHKALENKLNTTLTTSTTIVESANSFRTVLSTRYTFTNNLSGSVSMSMLNYVYKNSAISNFNELRGVFKVSYRI